MAAVTGIFVRSTLAYDEEQALFSRRRLSSSVRRAALFRALSAGDVDDRSAGALSVTLADAFSVKFRRGDDHYPGEDDLPILKGTLVEDCEATSLGLRRAEVAPLACLGLQLEDADEPSLTLDDVTNPRLLVTALLVRLQGLIAQWPANSTLERTARVADAVLRSDARTSTPTQVLAGIEILLRRAQDWQEHCAKEFSLESQLAPLRAFVSRGRKRELASWSRLLGQRELKAARNRVVLRALPRLDALLFGSEAGAI
ncbi:MAG: hypothetical protein AAF368_18515, partial [Planctomycetota bacterium]